MLCFHRYRHGEEAAVEDPCQWTGAGGGRPVNWTCAINGVRVGAITFDSEVSVQKIFLVGTSY